MTDKILNGAKTHVQESALIAPVMPTAVMGTNDNCTVSKRSVEMLYYPKPHFYRYFVKRPKKRTALINRGYLLRMKAIEHRLIRFLVEHKQQKVVINLGCGYDALPFRSMSEHAELTGNTTFVDVDYDTLIREKVQIIRQNGELHDLLQGLITSNQQSHIQLQSENYMAIGCDLADIRPLRQILADTFSPDASFFIISEVAITYMPVETADAILLSFSYLKNAQFCLLEQCLPNGPTHPFATTMLKHFNKLSSPLRVVHRYHTIQDQQDRFHAYGWRNVTAHNLWAVWSSEEVFSAQERIALRSKEVFDEHEEFTLFASHYFVLVASSSGPRPVKDKPILPRPVQITLSGDSQKGSRLRPRRNAVLYETSKNTFVHHGGDDGRSRLSGSQVYLNGSTIHGPKFVEEREIIPRKHHTITQINANHDYLLVGGRESPEKPLKDCWLRKNMIWSRVEDLPVPLFRHCATLYEVQSSPIDDASGVVVFGGKTTHAGDSNAWYLWREGQGWKQLQVDQITVAPRFSANLLFHYEMQAGVLLGGMLSSEVVCKEAYTWRLIADKICLTPLETAGEDDVDSSLHRAGATIVQHQDNIIIVGGVTEHGLPRKTKNVVEEISILRLARNSVGQLSILQSYSPNEETFRIPSELPQPMLIGHSTIVTDETITIIGGGAICFSFGSFMNSTSWHLSLGKNVEAAWRTGVWTMPEVKQVETLETNKHKPVEHAVNDKATEHVSAEGFIAINRILPGTRETLLKRSVKGKPCVFESVDLGACIKKWTLEYLKQALDSDRSFDVHHALNDTMLFESKNFQIRKLTFSDFVTAVVAGQRVYLRAVSLKDKHKPASFYEDFETLAPDFRLPTHLAVAESLQHSSILRISGSISMWLHYDTLSNILCQICGSKRLILFSPGDVAHLKIPPGRSSSDLNVFDPKAWGETSLKNTHPYEAILRPGDVLYIPPLWSHAALPLDKMSIAVNTFFKTEDDQRYAEGQDTYGNRDVSEYEHARKDVAKLLGRFKTMPKDTRRFYLERLADEILQQARKKD